MMANSSLPQGPILADVLQAFEYTFDRVAIEFGKCHQDPVNVLLHLVTTPLGMVGALSLLRQWTRSDSVGILLSFCYLVSLLPALTTGVFIGTLSIVATVLWLSQNIKMGALSAGALVALCYALQDLAHAGTGEETFQSTYSDGGHINFNDLNGWSQLFFEQVYYLIPLVVYSTLALPMVSELLPSWMLALIDAPMPEPMQRLRTSAKILFPTVILAYGSYCLDTKNAFCFFPGAPYYHRVLQCNILRGKDSQKKNLRRVRDWAMAQNPPKNRTSHWWYSDLRDAEKSAFSAVSQCSGISAMFRALFSERHYAVVPVTGMNEIYVSGPSRFSEVANSDNVFYTRHVDGPLGFIPFVSVYRCIVGMDRNEMITTHFPLADIADNACEGDVIGFDFNREVHFITRDEEKAGESDDFRVVLKLHYCIYPRILAPLGWLMHFLNAKYNELFRALFLTTINPTTPLQHFLAWNVNSTTGVFDWVETHVGTRSLLYLAMVSAISYATGVYNVFFALTSVVHYIRYITTFYVRKGVDFGSFKRDVLLFKSIALAQLFYHYFIGPLREGTFEVDVISLALIVSGFSVSLMATEALGIDRTYFGAELGIVEPKWIDKFPYGYIPHPMIVSQIWALLGFMKAQHFRVEWPYVIPIHVTFYVLHMLQEHFDIYDKQ